MNRGNHGTCGGSCDGGVDLDRGRASKLSRGGRDRRADAVRGSVLSPSPSFDGLRIVILYDMYYRIDTTRDIQPCSRSHIIYIYETQYYYYDRYDGVEMKKNRSKKRNGRTEKPGLARKL